MRYPPTVLANDETSARNSFRSLWLFPGRSRLYSMVFRSETRLSIKVWRSISAISASGLLKSIISTPLLFVVVYCLFVSQTPNSACSASACWTHCACLNVPNGNASSILKIPLHNFDLLLRQAVQFIYQLINLTICCINLTLDHCLNLAISHILKLLV